MSNSMLGAGIVEDESQPGQQRRAALTFLTMMFLFFILSDSPTRHTSPPSKLGPKSRGAPWEVPEGSPDLPDDRLLSVSHILGSRRTVTSYFPSPSSGPTITLQQSVNGSATSLRLALSGLALPTPTPTASPDSAQWSALRSLAVVVSSQQMAGLGLPGCSGASLPPSGVVPGTCVLALSAVSEVGFAACDPSQPPSLEEFRRSWTCQSKREGGVLPSTLGGAVG